MSPYSRLYGHFFLLFSSLYLWMYLFCSLRMSGINYLSKLATASFSVVTLHIKDLGVMIVLPNDFTLPDIYHFLKIFLTSIFSHPRPIIFPWHHQYRDFHPSCSYVHLLDLPIVTCFTHWVSPLVCECYYYWCLVAYDCSNFSGWSTSPKSTTRPLPSCSVLCLC